MEQFIWLALIVIALIAMVGGLLWLGLVVVKAIKSRRGKK